MMRLLGFGVLVVVVFTVLRQIPLLGSSSFIALWLSVIAVSAITARYGRRALRIARLRGEVHRLSQVDNPHTRGKLGTLLLSEGRRRSAIPHLEAAAEGEAGVCEWHYRLGSARLDLGRLEAAEQALRTAVELDEEYAYGAAQLRLAEVLRRRGAQEEALGALATFDRNHGPSPESAYRRGQILKALGQKQEARDAFREVGQLTSTAARYQKSQASMWALRAAVARLG